MSIFDLYSAEEIDTFIGKMGSMERTANTVHTSIMEKGYSPERQIDQNSVIQDILAMGSEILREKQDSLGEIQGLKSRQEDSFTIPQFQDIPETPKNKINKTLHDSTEKLKQTAIKHQTLHHKSLSRSIQKSSKFLDEMIAEESSKKVKKNKMLNVPSRLFEDQKQRKQKLKEQIITQRVKDEYKLLQQSKNTTVQLKVPFKKALERRGQQLTIGHRLYDNAQKYRVKKQQALLRKVQKQKDQISKISFQPDLSKSQSQKIIISQSFHERLEFNKQKKVCNKMNVLEEQLRKSPFKPKLVNKKEGASKISGLWKSQNDQSVSRKTSHDHLSKSFFSEYNKSFIKPIQKSSYIQIKNPEELNFLLE